MTTPWRSSYLIYIYQAVRRTRKVEEINMLILQRCPGQSIWIGNDIQIVVLGHSNGITRIGINAPPDVTIMREEIKTKERLNNHE